MTDATSRSPHSPVAWAARLVGLMIGGASAAAEALVLIVCAPLLAASYRGTNRRRRLDAVAHRIVGWEIRRVERCFGQPVPRAPGSRVWRYIAARTPIGLVGALLVLITGFGAVTAGRALSAWSIGAAVDGVEPSPFNVGYLGVLCLVLAFTAYFGLIGAATLEHRTALLFLGPRPDQALRDRIVELSTSRAAVVDAVDTERRRIERDLHDGVQQRLVALGMLIGRARRDGDRDDLLADAHQEALAALADLRDVSWRIYPAALDRSGLGVALETLAERATIPVTLAVRVDERPPRPVETVAYFVVSEAVANAAKHSGAERVDVTVERVGPELRVVVTDDGRGGADADGVGLTGLRRRVAAVDGELELWSPPGAGTRIAATMRCG